VECSFNFSVFENVFVQAQASLSESSQRLDLIRHSLELRNKELPPQQSAKAMELKKELESYTASSPTPSGGSSYVSLQPFKHQGGGQAGDTPTSCSSSSHLLGKSAAITGKLEVRLMGCQDLLEDVPGRSRRDSTHSAPNDLKSFVKGTSFCFVLKRAAIRSRSNFLSSHSAIPFEKHY
jgi:protein kinase N